MKLPFDRSIQKELERVNGALHQVFEEEKERI